MKSSPSILAAEAALTDVPRSAREIWQACGCWSLQTIKRALDALVTEGSATRTPETYRDRGNAPLHYLYARAG